MKNKAIKYSQQKKKQPTKNHWTNEYTHSEPQLMPVSNENNIIPEVAQLIAKRQNIFLQQQKRNDVNISGPQSGKKIRFIVVASASPNGN